MMSVRCDELSVGCDKMSVEHDEVSIGHDKTSEVCSPTRLAKAGCSHPLRLGFNIPSFLNRAAFIVTEWSVNVGWPHSANFFGGCGRLCVSVGDYGFPSPSFALYFLPLFLRGIWGRFTSFSLSAFGTVRLVFWRLYNRYQVVLWFGTS